MPADAKFRVSDHFLFLPLIYGEKRSYSPNLLVTLMKILASRVLTQSEVVDLLNPGANQGSPSNSPPGVRSGVPRTRALNRRENKNVIANVTLVSMYTIVVYLFGVITSVFLVDNGAAPGGFNYGRFLSFDAALQEVANNDGGRGGFKVVEILVYWLQNLVWQGEAGYVPT